MAAQNCPNPPIFATGKEIVRSATDQFGFSAISLWNGVNADFGDVNPT
jgi:hypothetical protein